jgi:hypothetical protein
MLIDPPSSLGRVLKSLQNQQQEAINSIAKSLNIKVGETISGTITEVTSASDTTKQRLLQNHIAKHNLNQPNSAKPTGAQSNNPASPTAGTHVNPASQTRLPPQLLTQLSAQPLKTKFTNSALSNTENLLLSSKLKLLQVEVKLQGVSRQEPSTKQVLVYTDQAVSKKQSVQLQLKASGDLVLLNTSTAPKSAQQTQAIQSQQVLSQALRNALPQDLTSKPHISKALESTLLLTQLTQRLGSFSLEASLPKNIQQSLQILASHLRSPEQLSKPDVLKQAVQNHGVQFENRLKQISDASPTNNMTLVKSNKVPVSPIASSAMTATTKTEASIAKTANTHSPTAQPLADISNSISETSLAKQDLKAALLSLANRLQASAANIRATAGQTGATATNSQSSSLTQTNTLIFLLKNLLANHAQLNQVKLELPREALVQQLQQLVQQALAKIQNQQLHSLSRKQSGTAESQGLSSHNWQLEIPIRYGQDVHTLSLLIEDDWVQQYKDNQEQNTQSRESEKVRKWMVKLGFDLPDAGSFHAHLTVINDSVKANIWAEKNETLEKALQQIDTLKSRLRKDGVNIESLECFPGKPPKVDNKLSYSLIDIKT